MGVGGVIAWEGWTWDKGEPVVMDAVSFKWTVYVYVCESSTGRVAASLTGSSCN